jgi:sugar phosphate isomerase/epimerase
MFIEGIAGLPRDQKSVERFEAEVRTAKEAGAQAIRVVIIPGRRYERFDSADEFRKFAAAGRKSLELAEPVAARHKMPLAVENHKDQRIPERLALLKHISSEWVGACVDTGNSIALLEDPIEVVEAYAPWAHCVHLKDQGVREYEDGFLLADVPLGEGFLDLPKMVAILRKAKPDVCFSFEGITRDPLKVPCLTEKYWATFADVPGRDLARTLRMVRAAAPEEPLPRVSHLTLDGQVRQEEDNVKRSLAYAREHLGL